MVTVAQEYRNPGNTRYNHDVYSRMLGFGSSRATSILRDFGYLGQGSRQDMDRFKDFHHGLAAGFGRILATQLVGERQGHSRNTMGRLIRAYGGNAENAAQLAGLGINQPIDLYNPRQARQAWRGVLGSESPLAFTNTELNQAMFHAYKVIERYGKDHASPVIRAAPRKPKQLRKQ